MRHRLFAVDVFPCAHSVDHNLLVPMIGNSGDQAIDFLVVEEIFVAAGDEEIGIAGNFARESVAAIVEIGGGDALGSGKRHCGGEQAGALHTDADDSETQPVTGSDAGIAGGFDARVSEKKCIGGGESAGGACSLLQEFAAREIIFHLGSGYDRVSEFKSPKV